jgi:hypothetical protein
MRHGRKWPPNRPDQTTKTTLGNWRQQDPAIDTIARRPMPVHFIRAFSILGWREAPWYYRCSWRVIGRWVNEAGKADCIAKRAAMRRNPERKRLKSMMSAYWTGEPTEPAWIVVKQPSHYHKSCHHAQSREVLTNVNIEIEAT